MRKIVIYKLNGGLANQVWSYLSLLHKLKERDVVIIDASSYLKNDIFGRSYELLKFIDCYSNLLPEKYSTINKYTSYFPIFKLFKVILSVSFFRSKYADIKYIDEDYNAVINVVYGHKFIYKFISPVNKHLLRKKDSLLSKIDLLPNNVCAIHFRSYGECADSREIVGDLDLHEYYKKSITRVIAQNSNIVFHIFSDSTPFAEKNIAKLKSEIDIANVVYKGRSLDPISDFYLLSRYSMIIAAPSTFSILASSFFSSVKSGIFVPNYNNPWKDELYPSNSIKIDC